MVHEKSKKIPDVLCPFFERECPLGEECARLCWRRMNSPDDALVDYEEFEVECFIVEWMGMSEKHPH